MCFHFFGFPRSCSSCRPVYNFPWCTSPILMKCAAWICFCHDTETVVHQLLYYYLDCNFVQEFCSSITNWWHAYVYRQNGCSVSNTKISYETSLLEIQRMHLYVTELVWNFIGQSIPTNASNSGWASSCQTFCFSLGFFRFPFSTVFLS